MSPGKVSSVKMLSQASMLSIFTKGTSSPSSKISSAGLVVEKTVVGVGLGVFVLVGVEVGVFVLVGVLVTVGVAVEVEVDVGVTNTPT